VPHVRPPACGVPAEVLNLTLDEFEALRLADWTAAPGRGGCPHESIPADIGRIVENARRKVAQVLRAGMR